ncbi:MAG: SUMF1/EgtB/PvdO family nonheme iron enzyme, partial [Planctomycetota bacterium]
KDVLAARLKAPAPNVQTLRPDLHAKTAAVVARMLEANPKNRYAGYEDLRHALEEAYAEAAGLQAPIAEAPRRHAGRWLFLGGSLLAAVAACVLAVVLLQPKSDTPPLPLPPRPAAVSTQPAMPMAARPALAPHGQTIAQDIDVVLSCDTTNAKIHYTLDGAEPTESSETYRTSVRIAPGTTIKARAFATGHRPSGVVAETYPEDQAVLTDIVPLRTRANQAWDRVKGLDPQQGLKAPLDAAGALRTNAEELYQKGAYGPAGQMYVKLVAACDALDKRQAARATAQTVKKETDVAIQALGGLPKDGGPAWKDVADRRGKADALYAEGKFEDAAALWSKADLTIRSQLRDSAKEAKQQYLEQVGKCDMAMLKTIGGKTYDDLQVAADKADKAMTAGDFPVALTNFQKAARLLPRAQTSMKLLQSARAVQEKADLAARLAKDQKLVEAGAAVEDVLKLDPYQPDAWMLRHQMASRAAATLSLDGNPASPTALKTVLIPGGTFEFGPATGSHKVTITKAFYLGQYEVTRGQFELFVKAMVAADPTFKTQAETGAVMVLSKAGAWVAKKDKTPVTWSAPGFEQKPDKDKHPVTCITWKEAQDFCKWAGEKSGATLRLPTEAEWEYACRAGTRTLFSFTPSADLPEYGNYADKSLAKTAPGDDRNANTAPVGTYKPNAWKLFDMHGNVMEWCGDWYQTPVPMVLKDPPGPESGTSRTVRGGSWSSPPIECTSSARRGLLPLAPSPMVGFRVVAATVPEKAFAIMPLALPTPPPLPDVYASELTPLPGSSNFVANLSFTRAPLKVAGLDYQQGFGLGTTAPLILPVKPTFKRFVGIAGLDENQRSGKPNAALRCRVFFDDVEVAATRALRYSDVTSWPVDIRIPDGVHDVSLVVEEVPTVGTKPDGNINW